MDPKLIPSLKIEALRVSGGDFLKAQEIFAWLVEDTYAKLVEAAKEEVAAKDTNVVSDH